PPVLQLLLLQAGRHGADAAVPVAQRQFLHDRALVGEELVERADRDPGPFGGERARQSAVAHLVDELGAGFQQPLHALRAALLHWFAAQRGYSGRQGDSSVFTDDLADHDYSSARGLAAVGSSRTPPPFVRNPRKQRLSQFPVFSPISGAGHAGDAITRSV